MKKIIDTQTTDDPDIFGETIREYCFDTKDDELGCYSCFKLRDGFVEVAKNTTLWNQMINALAIEGCLNEIDEDERDKASIYANGDIAVGWYWDGDGTLVIIEGCRMAINGDCKKTYGWEWVE